MTWTNREPGPALARKALMLHTMSTSNPGHLWLVRLHLLCLRFSPSQSCSRWLGCGLWQPEADPLATLRDDIVEHADRWKEVLRSPEIRREFLDGASDDDDAVVKAFAHTNRESALKTKPRVCSLVSLSEKARHKDPLAAHHIIRCA